MKVTITLSAASVKYLEYHIGNNFERSSGARMEMDNTFINLISAMVTNCGVNDLKLLEGMAGVKMELTLPRMLQKSSNYVRYTPTADSRGAFLWIEPGRQKYLDSFLRGMLKLECHDAALRAEEHGWIKANEVLKVLSKYDIEESEFRLDMVLRSVTRLKNKVKS